MADSHIRASSWQACRDLIQQLLSTSVTLAFRLFTVTEAGITMRTGWATHLDYSS